MRDVYCSRAVCDGYRSALCGFALRRTDSLVRVPCGACLALSEYKLVSKKGEGTFSEVLKAQCIKNGRSVAIKCMKNHFDSLEQARALRQPVPPPAERPLAR